MPSINANLMSLMGRHALARSQDVIAQVAERLATGKRINRASDDPAGSAAATHLRVDRTVIERKIEGIQRENARLGAQDGALSVVGDLLVELNGLVVWAANTAGVSQEERQAAQVQADSIIQTINHLSVVSVHGGEQLIAGYAAAKMGMVQGVDGDGEGGEEAAAYSLADLAAGGALNLFDGDLELAQRSVESALSGVTGARAAMGARMNGNDARVRTLMVELESTAGALSLIEDADFAAEVSNLVRGRLMEQVAVRTLLISRQSTANALELLNPVNMR